MALGGGSATPNGQTHFLKRNNLNDGVDGAISGDGDFGLANEGFGVDNLAVHVVQLNNVVVHDAQATNAAGSEVQHSRRAQASSSIDQN
jgi:hypothetical protein